MFSVRPLMTQGVQPPVTCGPAICSASFPQRPGASSGSALASQLLLRPQQPSRTGPRRAAPSSEGGRPAPGEPDQSPRARRPWLMPSSRVASPYTEGRGDMRPGLGAGAAGPPTRCRCGPAECRARRGRKSSPRGAAHPPPAPHCVPTVPPADSPERRRPEGSAGARHTPPAWPSSLSLGPSCAPSQTGNAVGGPSY